jgi:hypothetical protein
MRVRAGRLWPISLALLVAAVLVPPGCTNSDSVTGPAMGSASSSIDGAWSGNYSSYSPAGCESSSASAVFRQDGATVTGSLTTSTCGVAGVFKGTVQGSQVLGNVSMDGCIGGGASGTINGSELVLSIADLTKPLVTGDKTVMYGGIVTFHR